MDIPGGHAQPASRIEVWECNGHTNQLWRFDAGAWQIQYAADPTQCLDAGDMKPGTFVKLWACNGLPQQKWGFDNTAGTIYLAGGAVDATICLDSFSPVKPGNQLQIWGCNDYPQQQFSVLAGTTIRVNQDYHVCLDLTGGKATEGNSVELWPCNGLPNQQWIYLASTGQLIYGGNYGNPAMCIDAHDMKAGTQLMLWTCNGLSAQKFGYDAGMQTIYLPDSQSDAANCVDIVGGDVSEGGKVQVYSCNGCWNQQWVLGLGVDEHSQITLPNDDLSSDAPLTCPSKPGPSPGHGGTCVKGWPRFDTATALGNDPWGTYVKTVYGEIPNDPSFYPFCVGNLWMLYTTTMKSAGVGGVPASVGQCPTNNGKTEGQYYTVNNAFSPPAVAWSWHPLPHQAFPSNTWVEVIHMKFVSDEHFGAWFFYARGGGIWFNLGKTFAVQDHGDAYKKLGAHDNEDMCKKGALSGYDSIQFLAHSDGEFATCRSHRGCASMNYEIVSTKLKGMYSCTSADGKSDLIRTGWMGSKPCVCSNSKKTLNCAGVPEVDHDLLLV